MRLADGRVGMLGAEIMCLSAGHCQYWETESLLSQPGTPVNHCSSNARRRDEIGDIGRQTSMHGTQSRKTRLDG